MNRLPMAEVPTASQEVKNIQFTSPTTGTAIGELGLIPVLIADSDLPHAHWGTREFGFLDPDRNGLTICQDLQTQNPGG